MDFQVKYYGTRGSIPVPGRDFEIFGGNTTSVLVMDKDTVIIIDAGTGIRNIGADLIKWGLAGKKDFTVHILFTHSHWDHIQGFPFFVPAYFPNIHFHIYGATKLIPRKPELQQPAENIKTDRWDIKKTLSFQQCFQYFPVRIDQMSAHFTYHEVTPGSPLTIDHIKVDTLHLNHPNESIGYRFFLTNGSFTFCSDTEPSPESNENIIRFADKSNIFAYDSQYLPEEYENGKKGWGHSTYMVGAEISRRASIKEYHLIHHDPAHNDKFLIDLQEKASLEFPASTVIREGMEFSF